MERGFLSKEERRRCFIIASVTRMRKSRKICEAILTGRLLPQTGRSQSNEPQSQSQSMTF